MRSTIVPAQITTVEDRIAGRLGVSQILLLTMPVFAGGALFVVLPPFFNYATYKVVTITLLAALSALLAIRLKGRILLAWLAMLAGYYLRPRYYVFSKNSTYLRERPASKERALAAQMEKRPKPKKPRLSSLPSVQDLLLVQELATNPGANLRFTISKKGKLRAYFTQNRS